MGGKSMDISNIAKGCVALVQAFANKMVEVISSEFMKKISEVWSEIGEDIRQASVDPNSVFNYSKYEKRLNEMHWAWPYGVETAEVYNILKEVNNEKDFDSIMLNIFDENKICDMLELSRKNVAKHHKVLIEQVEIGIKNKQYALVNNAIMSVIDNSLSVYLCDKGTTTRKGIMQPIIEYYENCPLAEIAHYIYDLCMLSNNVDFVFESVDFNQKIRINSNKVARRHTALHGVKYSNNRIDTIMLLNTLVALLELKPFLKFFENGLKYDRKKKEFVLTDQMLKKMVQKKSEEFVLDIIEIDEMVTHAELRSCFEEAPFFEKYKENCGQYISRLLQRMKKKHLILNVHRNGKVYWIKNKE